jgi:hypothetical protein
LRHRARRRPGNAPLVPRLGEAASTWIS